MGQPPAAGRHRVSESRESSSPGAARRKAASFHGCSAPPPRAKGAATRKTTAPRNLADCHPGFLLRSRYLIHDRDQLFTKAFQRTLASSGVRPVKLPRRSPNLNAYAERFVRSIKSECLAQVIPIGEGHLRRVVREYVEHYHGERNHQGIRNRLIDSSADESRRGGSIECRERLGGLLQFYHRAA
jgi:hypothetical protein